MSKLDIGTRVKITSNRDQRGEKIYPRTIIGVGGRIVKHTDPKIDLGMPEYVIELDDKYRRLFECVCLDTHCFEVVEEKSKLEKEIEKIETDLEKDGPKEEDIKKVTKKTTKKVVKRTGDKK